MGRGTRLSSKIARVSTAGVGGSKDPVAFPSLRFRTGASLDVNGGERSLLIDSFGVLFLLGGGETEQSSLGFQISVGLEDGGEKKRDSEFGVLQQQAGSYSEQNIKELNFHGIGRTGERVSVPRMVFN